jgi:hypothetical protein
VASPTLYTFSGQQTHTRWRNPPAEAGLWTLSTTNIRGDKGLVTWLEEFSAELAVKVKTKTPTCPGGPQMK